MLAVRKLGKKFHVDYVKGDIRIRGALGTRSKDNALRLGHRLETAISEGPTSTLWSEMKLVLPHSTFSRFADHVGFEEPDNEERKLPTWGDLKQAFEAHMRQRIILNRLRTSTADRYQVTVREFDLFLSERRVTLLQDIDKPLVESFKVWRVDRINRRKYSRGATGLVLDAAILHRVFSYALENEMIAKNPVRMEGRPGENPNGGAEPFTGNELKALRQCADKDLLTFLLLRWTGLRGGDAVTLTWREVHFDRKEIERVTQKRRKKIILPIHQELLFALEVERDRRRPQPSDPILINPTTGNPMSRPRLYERMLALGRRAGVSDAHPHRFRDTLAVDMLCRGASPYDVAKTLGDTIETVEKHYTPFVRELRERVRHILESEGGLENRVSFTVKHASKSSAAIM